MEYDLYCQHVQKLKDFCNQMGLDFRLNCGSYPITLELTPNEWYRQASLFDGARNANNAAPALMTFALCDGEISFSATGGSTISDATFSKLKGLFNKISSYWTQFVFKQAVRNPNVTLKALLEATWMKGKAVANDD